MPQALKALQAAVELEEAQQKAALAQATTDKLPAPRFEAVSLRQRTVPFMDMIRQCMKAEQAITWGV
jgi:hypothetical protein